MQIVDTATLTYLVSWVIFKQKEAKLSKPCKSNSELGSVVPIVGALVIGNRYIL